MSAPPPYEHNPDTRALPDGWITQFDNNYKAWFYVNTRASPPVTTWTHPLGPPPPPPQQQYAPPPNAPPNQGYATSYSPSPSPNQYGYNNNQGSYSGYGGGSPYPPQQQAPYGAQQQAPYGAQQQGGKGLLGGLFGKHGNNGPAPGYGGGGYGGPSPQPQVVYVEQQPAKRQGGGIGMGGVALGAGAGLLGGVLLGEAIEDFDRPDVVEYNDTTVNNFGNDDGNDYNGDFDDGGGW